MSNEELKCIIEAILMNAAEPVSVAQLQTLFESWQQPSVKEIHQVLDELSQDYKTRAIELKLVASGYCLQTKKQYSPWISKMFAEKPIKYSRALLETLAIIAYRQPVTRADIEDIRGVSVNSSILKTLLEREWVKIAGHRDVPGKPAIYITTKNFLDYFNLSGLDDLPPLIPIETTLAIKEYAE